MGEGFCEQWGVQLRAWSRIFRMAGRLSIKVAEHDLTEVVAGLYLGSRTAAEDDTLLAKLGITHVLNVSSQVSHIADSLKVLHISIADSPKVKVRELFGLGIEFISTAIMEGNCLVHCDLGMSRSPTFVLAYMMKCKDFSLAAAIATLKELRPIISPNKGFMMQLLEYERELFNGLTSINLEAYERDRCADPTSYTSTSAGVGVGTSGRGQEM